MYTDSSTIIPVTDGRMLAAAAEQLGKRPDNTVLVRSGLANDLLNRLAAIDTIFSDLDGTIVEEGTAMLTAQYVEYIRQLAAAGVTVTLVTGKSYGEITELLRGLPPGLPLGMIYEKGAYCLRRDTAGGFQKQYLLTTPELEASVAELRRSFLKEKAGIERKYHDEQGRPRVMVGWAGKGDHQSVLSIDILAGDAPANYLDLMGPARDALKVKDAALLASIEADLQQLVQTHRPGWRLVHLGNGNSEIAPGNIDKDAAVRRLDAYRQAKGMMVLGDSGNDRALFALRHGPKVLAGLVLHRAAALPLAGEVDMVAFGMANAAPILRLVLQARAAWGCWPRLG